MIHLADDVLLAYVRQQQLDMWTAQMQEHLSMCPVCRRRCAEFKMTGDVLEAWAHSSASEPLYATVSNRVMRTLYKPRATPIERMWNGISRVRVVSPLAVVVVLLFAILLVGVRVNMWGNGSASSNVKATPTIVRQQATATPIAPTPTLAPMEPSVTSVPVGPVVTSTVVSGGGVTVTSTSQNVPTIKACTTVIDLIQNQLRVCGKNFTPDTSVSIYYHIGTSSKKHSTQVGADGTFNDMLYIQSCNDVPGSIYVQSSADPPETARIAKDITFGTCQGFGGLKKSKNSL